MIFPPRIYWLLNCLIKDEIKKECKNVGEVGVNNSFICNFALILCFNKYWKDGLGKKSWNYHERV